VSDQQLDRIESKVDDIADYVWRGKDGREPLTVRMDRVEQATERREFWAKTWAGAAVTGVVTALIGLGTAIAAWVKSGGH